MPKIMIPINDVFTSITRPVALQVSRTVTRLLGLSQDTDCYIQQDGAVVPLVGSTNSDSGAVARFSQNEKVFIEISEEQLPSGLITMYTTQPNEVPVFHDTDCGVVFTPQRVQTRMTLSLRLRSQDRATASRWRDALARRIGQDLQEFMLEFTYAYIIPKPANELVFLTHERLRTQETIQEYVRRCWCPKVVTVANQAQKKLLGIRERQVGGTGRFNFDVPPREEKGDGGAVHDYSIEYSFEYDQPTGLVLQYPIQVYNEAYPDEWINLPLPYDPNTEVLQNPTKSRSAYTALMRMHTPEHRPLVDGLVVPEYDDWVPKHQPGKTSNLLRVLLTLDPTKPRHLLSLTELDPQFVDPILHWWAQNPKAIAHTHLNPVVITVFEEDEMLEPGTYALDEYGDLVTNFDLDLNKNYRVRFGIVNDLSILHAEPEARLRLNGELGLLILTTLAPDLEAIGKLPKLHSGGGIRRPDWVEALKWIQTTARHYHSSVEVVRCNVTRFFVETHRS